MPTTLADVRDRLRLDLHDTDAAAYRWTGDALDRHIERALGDITLAWPQEKSVSLAVTPGSRDLSLAALDDLVELEAVEYPEGQYPPAYVRFSLWSSTLTLLLEAEPTEGNAKAWYTARHTLDGDGTTLSAQQVDLLITGAAAYAELEQATHAADRLTTGTGVAGAYRTNALARLTAFKQLLHQYGRRNRVRSRRLYAAG